MTAAETKLPGRKRVLQGTTQDHLPDPQRRAAGDRAIDEQRPQTVGDQGREQFRRRVDPIGRQLCEQGAGEEEVERRIRERGLKDLKYYNGATHRGVFAMPNFVREILAKPLKPITAATPLDEDNIDPSHHLHLKMVREG